MMDIIRAVYEARPNVGWENNSVNCFNLDTIKEAYIGDDFPTATELDTAWLTCLREEKKAQVKEEAYKRITSILPEWKQRNYTAKSVELTEKKVDGLTLTEDELNSLAAIKIKWASIQQIRTASDNIEIEVDNISNIEFIEAYGIQNNVLWP
ncbi:hypothetical protein KAR91_04165 [Candidatus Pacearchaeota archaeon]|nr:hypothetical protein [Candidatus Pacearchaeota archaeon]